MKKESLNIVFILSGINSMEEQLIDLAMGLIMKNYSTPNFIIEYGKKFLIDYELQNHQLLKQEDLTNNDIIIYMNDIVMTSIQISNNPLNITHEYKPTSQRVVLKSISTSNPLDNVLHMYMEVASCVRHYRYLSPDR